MELRVPDCAFFMDRNLAEEDEKYLQIIPYCLIKNREIPPLMLEYQRTSKTGEKRLVNKMSIGIGGHVNPVDSDHGETPEKYFTLSNNIIREIREETGLTVRPVDVYKPIGIILLDEPAVCRVHIGLACIVEVPDLSLAKPADGSIRINIRAPEEVYDSMNYSEAYEEWSYAFRDFLLEMGGY